MTDSQDYLGAGPEGALEVNTDAEELFPDSKGVGGI